MFNPVALFVSFCSWHVLLKKLVVPVTSFGFPAHITTQGLALLANTPVALSVRTSYCWWCGCCLL
jgi:hypothetical protein